MAKFGRDVKRRFSKIEKRSTGAYIPDYAEKQIHVASMQRLCV
jgi:hypothetical protein